MSAPSTSMPPGRTTMAQRTVDRLARRVDRGGVSRRSFLVRTAVVGSALAVAPLQWVLRPTTAYASVCGDGARCNQGWTAFCCTINNGANTCPPGSYVAGWWKIDRSPFCQGAPRYIIDCNRRPGSSCRCRCASGTCDQRRVCCNNFRYGQCNTQIPGVTEVVCRVVVCTTPWTWDPSCGRTLRTDNRTTSHNAPCLPGRGATVIDMTYQDLGLTGSPLGRAVAAEQAAPRSGRWRRFERGVITWRPQTTPLVLVGAAAVRYRDLDGPSGSLGYPTGPEQRLPSDGGTRIGFERGSIYASGSSAVEVVGPADVRYRALGGPTGVLGRPTVGTRPVGDGLGSVTQFQNGAVYTSGGGAHELLGPVAARYAALNGPAGSGLGYPVGTTQGDVTRFTTGVLVRVGDQVRVLRDAIARRFLELGGTGGDWGRPTRDQDRLGPADRAVFGPLTVLGAARGPVWALRDPVLAAYLDAGGPAGSLGLPTTDTFRTRSGDERGEFVHGAIEVDRRTGDAVVLRPTTPRRAQELP